MDGWSIDDCGLFTIKEEIFRSSYVSLISHRMEQEKFTGLNTKFGPLLSA